MYHTLMRFLFVLHHGLGCEWSGESRGYLESNVGHTFFWLLVARWFKSYANSKI